MAKILHGANEAADKAFIQERLAYEEKNNLDHNSRPYHVRKRFKAAGIMPKGGYTNDEALGELPIGSDSDFDLLSVDTIHAIDEHNPMFDQELLALMRQQKQQ